MHSFEPYWFPNSRQQRTALLMSHLVSNVVDRDPQRQRCKLFRIVRIIGVLPGISQIHVMTDGDLDPAFVVVNTRPARVVAIEFVGSVATQKLRAGDLK